MALLGSLNKPLMSTRGPLGKIIEMVVKGAGGGVASNVVDKELLKGKAKALAIKLPAGFTSALGPVTVTANATDLGMALAVNGLKMPSRGSLMTIAGLWFAKKIFEARGWIVDDPITVGEQHHMDRIAQSQEQRRERQMTPPAAQYTVFPNLWGGQYR